MNGARTAEKTGVHRTQKVFDCKLIVMQLNGRKLGWVVSFLGLLIIIYFFFNLHDVQLVSTGFNPPILTSSTLKSFESGWDNKGIDIFNSQMVLNIKRPASTHEVAINPLGNVTFYTGPLAFFNGSLLRDFVVSMNGVGGWEPETFEIFLRYLSHSDYYVDFGTWIGPTLFFAAQMVKSAVGIEADPAAYAIVSYNAALNKRRTWGHRVSVIAAAIGIGSHEYLQPVRLDMKSSFPGSSCSGNGKFVYFCGGKKDFFFWKVNSYTLPSVMKAKQIPETKSTFIKIDVESFECSLIPSWLPWLQRLGNDKPTLFISTHAHISPCTPHQNNFFFEIFKIYKHAHCIGGTGSSCITNNEWFVPSGFVVFSDFP